MACDVEAFRADLDAAGLSVEDLRRLTGRDRRSVWRWLSGRTAVPTFARTIVQQHLTIRRLADELATSHASLRD